MLISKRECAPKKRLLLGKTFQRLKVAFSACLEEKFRRVSKINCAGLQKIRSTEPSTFFVFLEKKILDPPWFQTEIKLGAPTGRGQTDSNFKFQK